MTRQRTLAVLLLGTCLAACASGPPVGGGSFGFTAYRTPEAAAPPPGFPGQVPDDEPGSAVVQAAPTTGQADPDIPGAVTYDRADPSLQAGHSAVTIDYEPTGDQGAPPVGGLHYPVWLNCGIYEDPVPTGYAVHDLEHGAVWITYPPAAPDATVDQLEDLVRSVRTVSLAGADTGQRYVTLSPYVGQTAPVVVTAWAHQLTLQTVDERAIRTFVRRYRTTAGVTPELGASCSGTDKGTPIP